MAGSVAVPVGKIADPLVERLVRHAGKMKVGPTDGDAEVDMGPVITREHLDNASRLSRHRPRAKARRSRSTAATSELQSATAFCSARASSIASSPQMRVAKEEIFGPVLSVVRAGDLDEALADRQAMRHTATAPRSSRAAARRPAQFKQHFNAGMIGINVGVPAPMAWFPFTGWNQSFFGDLHIQGTEGVQFYTQQKMTMTRWFASASESQHDPIWKTGKR